MVLFWRFGLVAFGGRGEVAPGVDKFRSDQFLPAGGTGIRFLLSKQYHVNLRTDFAWGKDTFAWSVGVRSILNCGWCIQLARLVLQRDRAKKDFLQFSLTNHSAKFSESDERDKQYENQQRECQDSIPGSPA